MDHAKSKQWSWIQGQVCLGHRAAFLTTKRHCSPPRNRAWPLCGCSCKRSLDEQMKQAATTTAILTHRGALGLHPVLTPAQVLPLPLPQT